MAVGISILPQLIPPYDDCHSVGLGSLQAVVPETDDIEEFCYENIVSELWFEPGQVHKQFFLY